MHKSVSKLRKVYIYPEGSQIHTHMGALSEAVVLNADGSLGFEEQERISAWLNERMISYSLF